LKFGKLAQRDRASRRVSVTRDVVVVRAINKQINFVLVGKANYFGERFAYGTSVLKPDYDVCVDEQFEAGHRSTKRCNLRQDIGMIVGAQCQTRAQGPPPQFAGSAD
jgi:hypothetical protein